jgi:2-keto-4-pentenoate hydratase
MAIMSDGIVVPGALHRMVPAGPGDVFRAEFAYLGAVTVRFSNGGGKGGGPDGSAVDRRRPDRGRTRAQGHRPFTDADPGLDAETGYQVQRLVVQHRLDRGERLIGAKLGLTSRAKQEAMGVREPLYGWLTSDMVHPHGEPLPLDELIHPRAEPETGLAAGTRAPGAGRLDLNIINPVSHIPNNYPIATGAAFALRYRGTDDVAVA